MTNDEIYISHKKENVINIIDKYNSFGNDKCDLIKDQNKFDLHETFCSSNRCNHCGDCCKSFPCVFSPNDFLNIEDTDYMLSILETGLVCIAWYGALPIIRPRGILDTNYAGINSFKNPGNPCLLLSKEGCLLPSNYRPSEGLLYYLSNAQTWSHKIIYSEEQYKEDYWEVINTLYELLNKYKQRHKPIDDIIKYKDLRQEKAKQLVKALSHEKEY